MARTRIYKTTKLSDGSTMRTSQSAGEYLFFEAIKGIFKFFWFFSFGWIFWLFKLIKNMFKK